MYAKTGALGDALRVFSEIKRSIRLDSKLYTTMLNGYAIHGHGKEALSLLKEMQNRRVELDEVSLLCALNACSHAGMVEDALRLYQSMEKRLGIKPTMHHQTAVMDALGRAGRLEEAEQVMQQVENPDIVVWRTFLGSCRVHGDQERAERILQRAKAMAMGANRDAPTLVLLSNIYAANGEWEKVRAVRDRMRKEGIRKEPGRSSIEIDGEVHSFVVADTRHPDIKQIHALLHKLYQEMKEAGFVPETSFVLHDVDEETKEEHLCFHSEKLAIGLGLLKTPKGTTLRIFKNLRVCRDCHNATALISKLVGREIIVRDANRFHHFKDGSCSCNNYW